MTRRLLPCLLLLMACASAVLAQPAAPYQLAYGGRLGETAVSRLILTAEGEQTSLDERRPVRLEAEYELRERVVSVEPDGSFRIEVNSHLVRAKDPSHLLNGYGDPKPQQVRVSARGEMLEVAPSADGAGLRERAATALLGQPQLVVLSEGSMEAGAAWDWAKEGRTQTNRLVAVQGGVAKVTSAGKGPVSLHERSQALGLSTDLEGTVEQTSTLELELATGHLRRHRGTMTLRTDTEIGLAAETGSRTLHATLRLQITFDERLVRVEGPPAPPATEERG
jgi:hypothetical protein